MPSPSPSPKARYKAYFAKTSSYNGRKELTYQDIGRRQIHGRMQLTWKAHSVEGEFFFALETKAAYKSRTVQSKDVGRVSKVVKFDELTPLRKLLASSEDFSNAGAEGGVPDNATLRGNSDEQRRYCLATNIDRIFFFADFIR